MLRSVQLDNDLPCEANKIDDVRTDRRLPTKLRAQLANTKKVPEQLLGLSFRCTTAGQNRAGSDRDTWDELNPPPQPSPQGGGGRKDSEVAPRSVILLAASR